jgi:hypothetical protein
MYQEKSGNPAGHHFPAVAGVNSNQRRNKNSEKWPSPVIIQAPVSGVNVLILLFSPKNVAKI